MILLDLSRVFHANIAVHLRGVKDVEIGMLRHMILNSIRASKVKFGNEYGELVIAMDSKKYWRRNVFPYYKAQRSVARAASDIDWNTIFGHLDTIREEITEFLPYKTIRVDGAEADDVIAVLTKKYHAGGVLILANDKDFIQLHNLPNVKQWNPVQKKFIRHNDPDLYRHEHIIRGDGGDGVPSILEADNALVVERAGRRPSITQKRLGKWLSGDPKLTMSSEEYRNWMRNRELIDFDYIPEDIVDNILTAYEEHPEKDRKKLFNYFITRRLRLLTESISDF